MATTTTVAPEVLDKLFGDGVERYELVDGQLQAKPMVSIAHGLMISWISTLLNQQIGEDLYVIADPLAKIREDAWRRPDIAVLRAEDAAPWKYIMPGHWPLLCVEMVSPPKQTVEEMLKKCELYHQQGVSYCWVIEPESRAAWTHHNGAGAKWVSESAGDVLDADRIGIQLGDLWRGLKNKRSSRVE